MFPDPQKTCAVHFDGFLKQSLPFVEYGVAMLKCGYMQQVWKENDHVPCMNLV